ncbi:MAG: fimbrillin family protein [Muribaculaceae bacterium]|nr:fimbrillin family protein [Muribaculaceae bacterium]
MKHTLLLLPLAALALASCSNDETVSLARKEGAIGFRPAMGSATRATETNNANLTDIYVTSLMNGQQYFKDIKFSKGSDSFFASAEDYRWPGDTTVLDFYAYAPSMDELGADITIDKDTKELTSFTVAENIADQVDFITAHATGTRDKNEVAGVPLTFDHRLAQVEVRAKSDSKVYTYKVAGVRIGRPQTTGTFDFTTNEWTLDDWHDTAVFTSNIDEVTLTSDAQSIMGTAGNGMFIPQTLTPWSPTNDPDNVAREAYLSVLINISTADGVQMYPYPSDKRKNADGTPIKYAWASIPLSGTWEQGKHYIYTLDFTRGAGTVDPDDPTPGKPVLGDPIKFTVQVNDWVDADNTIDMSHVNL